MLSKESTASGRINVLYASDGAFAAPLLASVRSLVSNATAPLDVYIVGEGLSLEVCDAVSELVEKRGHRVRWIAAPDYRGMLGFAPDVRNYSAAMFSRFCLESLLPESVQRVIYLDCDTIVAGDIVELWTWPLCGKTVGAVNDYRSCGYARNLGITVIPYVNSGVLLVDVARYRQLHCEQRLFSALQACDGLLEFPDNDLLCMVLQHEIALLPVRFNVHSVVAATKSFDELCFLRAPQKPGLREEYEKARKSPVIVHFTRCFLVTGRPWYDFCDHPLREYYDAHALPAGECAAANAAPAACKSAAHVVAGMLPRWAVLLAARVVHAYLKPLCQGAVLRVKGGVHE